MANKKVNTTKKAASKKKEPLPNRINEEGLDVVFGALLMGIGEFHGDVLEKIVFICGVALFIIGTILSGNKARKAGKKGLARFYYFACGFAVVMITVLVLTELGVHLIP